MPATCPRDRYIASIRREAAGFGACKIVPPPGWRPATPKLPPEMPFTPRLMPIHKLQQAIGYAELASHRHLAARLADDGGHFSHRYKMGGVTTVAQFEAAADACKKAFCAKHDIPIAAEQAVKVEEGGEADAARKRTREAAAEAEAEEAAALEKCFWRIVQAQTEQLVVPYGGRSALLIRAAGAPAECGLSAARRARCVQVPYGADLDVSTHTSGFGNLEGGAWNLNKLANAPGSLLDPSLHVPGVTVPWLYVGHLFGAFCWHTEDLWLYSCNYMHYGAPKTWCVGGRSHA